MRLRRTAVALLASAVLTPATAAAAGKTYLPPGKAGASEYSETIPAPGGNVTPPSGNSSAGGADLARLGAARPAVRKLTKLGRDGAQAAAFARATAPGAATTPATASGNALTSAQTGGSAAGGVLDLLGGSDAGGIGLLLPLLLAFSLGAALMFAAVRVRRWRQPSA